jgi:SAM-dependent methyltransferase
MHAQAYVDLHQLEARHWWYQGTRAAYRALLRRYVPRECRLVLDVGCGSGGNLRLLADWGRVVGVDPWPPALHMCPPGAGALVQGWGQELPFADETFGLVAMLDVIEHVVDDMGLLREARRVCRPGGMLLVFTSAFRLLWSAHDEANRHVRRYTAGELRAKAERAGLRVCRLSYQCAFVFPLAAAIRLLQRLLPPQREVRVDMWPVPDPINAALAWLLSLEGKWIPWLSFPFGVGLVAVLERP